MANLNTVKWLAVTLNSANKNGNGTPNLAKLIESTGRKGQHVSNMVRASVEEANNIGYRYDSKTGKIGQLPGLKDGFARYDALPNIHKIIMPADCSGDNLADLLDSDILDILLPTPADKPAK